MSGVETCLFGESLNRKALMSIGVGCSHLRGEFVSSDSRYSEGIRRQDSSLYGRYAAVAQHFAPKESDRKGEGSVNVKRY